MRLAAFAAALAVIAVPMAVRGAEGPARPEAAKRVCDVNQPTGSRLGGVRRCRTKSERDAAHREARNTVDRIQAFKPVVCGPGTRIPTC